MRALRALPTITAIAVLLSGCGGPRRPPPPRWVGATATATKWHLVELDNGLKLVLLPDPSVATVTVVTHLAFGGKDDPEGEAGLAHVAEHAAYMMHAPGDDQTLDDRLAEVAVWNNAETTVRHTAFFASALPQDLDAVLALEAHRLRGDCTGIDAAKLVTEREVVLNELRDRESISLGIAPSTLLPGAQPLGGTEASVARLGLEDVCRVFAQHYNPAAAVVVIAGPVTIEQGYAAALKTFGAVPARKVLATAPLPGDLEFTGYAGQARWALDARVVQAIYRMELGPNEGPAQADLLANTLERALDDAFRGPNWSAGTTVNAVLGIGQPLLIVTAWVKPGHRPVVGELDDFVADQLDEWLDDASDDKLVPNDFARARAREQAQLAIEAVPARAGRFAELVATVAPEQVEAAFAPYEPKASEVRARLRDTIASGARVVWLEPFEDDVQWVRRFARQGGEAPSPEALLAELHGHGDDGTRIVLPAAARPERRTRRLTLDNGLEVVLEDTGAASSVTSAVLRVDVGVAHDSAQAFTVQYGYGSRTMVARRNNALTHDAIYFEVTDIARDLPAILQVTRDLAFTPRFNGFGLGTTAEELAREPGWVMSRRLFGAEHPYGRLPKLPTRDMRRNGVSSFRATHFRPGNATLYVVGRFDLEAVVEQLHYAMDEWKPGDAPAALNVPAAAPRPGVVTIVEPHGGLQLGLQIGYATAATKAIDEATRRVLTHVLDRRVWQLRERLGVVYTPRVFHEARRHAGAFVIELSVDDRAAAQALAALDELVADLVAHGPTPAELVAAQRAILREVLAGEATSLGRARSLAERELLGLTDDLDALLRDVTDVTAADVTAMAETDLTPRRRVVLGIGTREQIDAFVAAAKLTDVEEIVVPKDDDD